MSLHYKIIGTTHKHQLRDQNLRALLAVERRAVLIAEEVNANLPDEKQKSVGRTFATENAIPWLSVDMTFARQRDAGIYEALQEEFRLRQNGVNAYAKDAQAVRENFWLDRIRDECAKRGITDGTVIITCGRNHMPYLAEKAHARWRAQCNNRQVPTRSQHQAGRNHVTTSLGLAKRRGKKHP